MEMTPVNKNTLYIVSTPIGNIKDITIRALEVLSQVDVLLVEDTRSIQYLLRAYKITPREIISYHSQNEKERLSKVIGLLSYSSVALVSEAGTPLICDPGILLVKEVIKKGFSCKSIPGVTAFTTLLPLTGFSLQDFAFYGFLSSKSEKRKGQLKNLLLLKTVLIFYESPHRISSMLGDISEIFSESCFIVIGRELTKEFETIYRMSLKELKDFIFSSHFVLKGEFCIILDNR